MKLHQANELADLLERLQSLRDDFESLAEELAQIRKDHEDDKAGEEWKEGA